MRTRLVSPTERAELAAEIAAAAPSPGEGHSCACSPAESPAQAVAGGGWPDPRRLAVSLMRSDATRQEAELFLGACRQGGFHSACVPPRWAALAVAKLDGCPTRASSWIAFPHGASLTPVKCLEAEVLLRLGVRDMWMVADVGSLRSRDLDAAFVDIRAVAQIAECFEARLTVTLEIPFLPDRHAVEACAVAKLAGATAVAVTTGHRGKASEPRHIDLIRRSIGGDLEVVASGGIERPEQASAALAAGADRVETSHCLTSYGGQVAV